MHTIVAIHCMISRSAAENHGPGVVAKRTSGQLPNSSILTLCFPLPYEGVLYCPFGLFNPMCWKNHLESHTPDT